MRTEIFYHRFKCDGCNKTAKARSDEHNGKPHASCTIDPKGVLRYIGPVYRVVCSSSDMMDHTNGACLACGAIVESGIEPDARGYACESCTLPKVYGLEELLVMGFVIIEEDDE